MSDDNLREKVGKLVDSVKHTVINLSLVELGIVKNVNISDDRHEES